MRAGLVFNSAAGGGRRGTGEKVQRYLEEAGLTVEAAPTRGPGDAIQLTQDLADRVDVMVAAGRDATVSEVINGLMGRAVPLGLVPTGRVDVLALKLGLPLVPVGAAGVLAGRVTRTL